MKRFRFRLTQLLGLRERLEERRRDELAAARDAVRQTREEIDRMHADRRGAQRAIESVDAPDAARRRRDLVFRLDFLDRRIGALEAELAARRRAEESACDALLVAVRDRKILSRLRERRRHDHIRSEERSEQAILDDLAQRGGGRPGADDPGSAFPERKKLPPEDL